MQVLTSVYLCRMARQVIALAQCGAALVANLGELEPHELRTVQKWREREHRILEEQQAKFMDGVRMLHKVCCL